MAISRVALALLLLVAATTTAFTVDRNVELHDETDAKLEPMFKYAQSR